MTKRKSHVAGPGKYKGVSPWDVKTLCDEDECAADVSRCVANAYCVDTIGSYECLCMAGYTGQPKVACTG